MFEDERARSHGIPRFICDQFTLNNKRSTNLPNDPANKMADEPEPPEHSEDGDIEIDVESVDQK